MSLTFDIAEDELNIFMGEAEEQLQLLDEGFVRLEREGGDPELLQAIFRAAHTLKGASGTIGHHRMAELTHALETVLDGLRKQTLAVSLLLVDTCLEALDVLRLLLSEVTEGEARAGDIAPLVARLAALAAATPPTLATNAGRVNVQVRRSRATTKPKSAKSNGRAASKRDGRAAASPAKPSREARPRRSQAPTRSNGHTPGRTPIAIRADISPHSAGSAARAFQLMLALQGLGEIRAMEPSQAQIETAAPVRHFGAELATIKTRDEIRAALTSISDLDRLVIGDEVIELARPAPGAPVSDGASGDPSDAPEEASPRLGDFLVSAGFVSSAQMEAAHRMQAETGSSDLIGQVLVKTGALTQAALDRAVAQHIQQLRAALKTAQAATAERAPAKAAGAEKTVRTSVERLDNLMNLVGELITDRNRLYQIRGEIEARFHGDEAAESLTQTVVHVGRLTDQLQEEVMRIRMLPVANVFHKFPRLVRDLARKAGKQVEVVIRGEDTELDRSVIEEISDPLIHLLRNAVDHGLETPAERAAAGKPERGLIRLTARHEESRIVLTVEDDGRGIDADKVKAAAVQRGLLSAAAAAALSPQAAIDLIFASGLSTAKVVSDLSGRGVGMDIVRTNIERLNGTIQVETRTGHGTTFQIVLPLTLAIVPALLVRAAEAMYAIPLAMVMEALRVPAADTLRDTVQGRPVIRLRERVLPLVRLHEVLGFTTPEGGARAAREYVVAVRWGKLEMGLMVEALVGEQEMVVKPLGALVGETPGVSGAAILGDGRVAMIVDVPGLFTCAGATGHSSPAARHPSRE